MGRAPRGEFIAFIVRPSLGQATDAVRLRTSIHVTPTG